MILRIVPCECLFCGGRTDWAIRPDDALTEFLSDAPCAHCASVDGLEPIDIDEATAALEAARA